MNTFDSVIHQPKIVAHFRTVLESGRVPHAYILQGERFSGKEYVARTFAAALLCSGKEGEKPCGLCHSCIQFASGNHPDFITVRHEKPGVISVQEIREQVVDTLEIAPYQSDRKVYMISESELMRPEAQNALLKSFEEPPAYAVIMLLTTDAEALLKTLRSRAVLLTMQPVPESEVRRYLMEEVKAPPERIEACVAFARGNVGKAKLLASNEEYEHLMDDALGLLHEIKELDASQISARVRAVSDAYKLGIRDYFDILSIWFRDVLYFKAANDPNGLVLKEELTGIRKMASESTYEGIEKVLDALSRAGKRIQANVNFDLAMELLLMTIRENC